MFNRSSVYTHKKNQPTEETYHVGLDAQYLVKNYILFLIQK